MMSSCKGTLYLAAQLSSPNTIGVMVLARHRGDNARAFIMDSLLQILPQYLFVSGLDKVPEIVIMIYAFWFPTLYISFSFGARDNCHVGSEHTDPH